MSTSISVCNDRGEEVSKRELSSDVFDAKLNEGLIHQAVRWQLAKRRSGTHSVLNRKIMRGGGAKPWKQKGTGRARAGSSLSPVWVGGAVAHGPKPRSYEFSINKKERRAALRGALSERHRQGKVLCVEAAQFEEAKTKKAQELLKGIGFTNGSKVLVVLPSEGSDAAFRSFRNLAFAKPVFPGGLNVFDIVGSQAVVFLGSALEEVEKRLQ